MGMNKPDIHDQLRFRRTDLIFDHFNNYTSGQLWTSGGASGTVANNDGDGGILTLTTGAVQSQSAWVATTRNNWTFVAGKPMLFQTAINYTEAATNQAAIFVGWAVTMNGILTNVTGVPNANTSACGIYKRPGETLWRAFSSVGTTQNDTQSKTSTLAPGITQELGIMVMINANSQLEATFFTGGMGPPTTTGGGPLGQKPMLNNVTGMSGLQPIKHYVSITGAAAMQLGVYVLAGSGSSEVVSVDYISAEHLAIP